MAVYGHMKRAGVNEAKNGLSGLLGRGVAVPPRASLDVERFLRVPVTRLTGGAPASEIIVGEREASR